MKDNMTAKLFEALHEVNEDRFSKTKKSILEMTTSEVIEEEATEDKSYKMCPRCGRPYSDYPAISRYDDKTEICPDCGVEEAMINYTGGTLEAPNKYKDEARKYNKGNSKRVNEEVTIDTPTQEDLDKDEANTKALDKKQIEDRIGELKIAIEDEAISDDEREAVEKEINELEDSLNEGAYLDNRDELIACFNEAYFESKSLQSEIRFTKPNVMKLRESIAIVCDNLDKLGELLASIDNSEEKKTLKEDSYEESFFAEIEDALMSAGFNVTRYSDAGMMTPNLGWIVSNSEGEVNLTCAGTYLNESDDQEDSNCEDKKKVSDAKSFDEVIDLLVADEEEAIEGYNEAIEKLKELDEKEKEKLIDMLSHIRDEEKEHIDELENKEIEEHE